jgi:hypothetical protein
MNLPTDFHQTLELVSSSGIFGEDDDKIEWRAQRVLEGRLAATQREANLGSITDWASRTLRSIKYELHRELCDKTDKSVKKQYEELFSGALTTDGVQAIASIVGTIVTAVNPALFVSSVLIYVSIWLLKIGVNHWCAIDVAAP